MYMTDQIGFFAFIKGTRHPQRVLDEIESGRVPSHSLSER